MIVTIWFFDLVVMVKYEHKRRPINLKLAKLASCGYFCSWKPGDLSLKWEIMKSRKKIRTHTISLIWFICLVNFGVFSTEKYVIFGDFGDYEDLVSYGDWCWVSTNMYAQQHFHWWKHLIEFILILKLIPYTCGHIILEAAIERCSWK